MPTSGRGHGSAPSPGNGTVATPTAGGGSGAPPATGNGSVGTPTSASVSGAARKLGRGSGSTPASAAARTSGGAPNPVRSSMGTPPAGHGGATPLTGHCGAAMPSTGHGSGNPNASRNSMPTSSSGRGSMPTPNNKRGRGGSTVPATHVRQPPPQAVWRPLQQLQYASSPHPAPPLRQPAPPPQRQQQMGLAVGMYSSRGGQPGLPLRQAPTFMQAPPQGQQPMLAVQVSAAVTATDAPASLMHLLAAAACHAMVRYLLAAGAADALPALLRHLSRQLSCSLPAFELLPPAPGPTLQLPPACCACC